MHYLCSYPPFFKANIDGSVTEEIRCYGNNYFGDVLRARGGKTTLQSIDLCGYR